MAKDSLDFSHGPKTEPSLGKFALWMGVLSLLTSPVVVGILFGIFAYVSRKKVQAKPEVYEQGKAEIGGILGCTGMVISVVCGVILLGMLIADSFSR